MPRFHAALSLLAIAAVAAPAAASAALPRGAKISTEGVGPVKIGMTLAEASSASGRSLELGENNGCAIVPVANGVRAMFTDGIVTRIYVRSRAFPTLSGVRFGDTESRLRAVYGSRLRKEPHKYVEDGWYYTFTDGRRRVRFEVGANGRIFLLSTGRTPEIDLVEGCG